MAGIIIPERGKKTGTIPMMITLLFFLASLCASATPAQASPHERWGTIMQPDAKTNIREKRTIHSRVRGSLMPGQKVRADFLRDDWYAVFDPEETERSEKKALGYVYAPRLFKVDTPAETKGEPTAVKKSTPATYSVTVKSIRCKVLPEGKEVLLVEFDRSYMPAVYSIEGDKPMIVMDVTRTASMKKEWAELKPEGALIRRVQANLNSAAGILTITLEMAPKKDYTVNPVVYVDDRIYALEVHGAPAPAR
jgi:hypothetical protein